jgi:hypothetical protein
MIMAQSTAGRQRKANTTEADVKSVDGKSGNGGKKKSGKDAASHIRNATGQGAGGGKKQQRHH